MEKTYWQKLPDAFGPVSLKDYPMIRQTQTRDVQEDMILRNSNVMTELLDVGCNTGVLAWRLDKKGYTGNYTGVDSNEKSVQCARKNMAFKEGIFFEIADAECLPFPDGKFDIVLSKDVIEHVADYVPILKEKARVCKGMVILSMFIRMTDDPDVIVKHPAGYYLNRYNRARLLKVMSDAGFPKVESIFRLGDDEVLVFRM